MTTAIAPPCDELAARPTPAVSRDPGAGTMIATVLGSSLAMAMGSIVNVALPAMQRDFATDGAGVQWIVNAYLLPLSALVLLGGSLGDRLGRKRFLQLGLGVFVAGTLGCAVAPGLTPLLLARFVQGIGAALIAPNSLGLLADAYTGESRGRAIGTWAAASTIAGAAAPLLGGIVVDQLDWRWAFAIVIPPAIAAWLIGGRAIREGAVAVRSSLDVLGAALAIVLLGATVVSLTRLSAVGRPFGAVSWPAAIALVSLALFVVVERRRRSNAMLPLLIFKSSSFVGITILTLLLYGALGGLMVLLPYQLIGQLGYSATQAGTALLPLPLVMGVSRAMGGAATRWGVSRTLTLGPTIVAVGFGLLATVPYFRAGYWAGILPGLMMMSVGMSLTVAPLTIAVMNAVDPEHVGIASGINNAVARTAGLIATALLGIALPSAAGGAAGLSTGFGRAAWVGVALACAAALTAFFMLRDDELGASRLSDERLG